MGNALITLKFVSAKRMLSATDPIQFRRQKLIKKLDEQIAMAEALRDGHSYTVTRTRRVRDTDSGEKRVVQTLGTVRQWWFMSDSGKVAVQLRYGSKVITLSKNRNAVEVSNPSELLTVLQTLRTAVAEGELDNEISIAADVVRTRFVKTKNNKPNAP
jgi:hypothetical protein